jgi:hypothetical protein
VTLRTTHTVQEQNIHDKGVYLEEILTYKRRPRQAEVEETDYHTIEGITREDIFSEDENAPNMEDLPEIQG